jgi:hypothetical protein
LDKQLYYKLFTITCLSLAFLGLIISNISSNIYAKYDYFLKWGSSGKGPGEFQVPQGIDVDSLSNVFVADTGNYRIQQFKLANPCPAGSTQVVPGVCFVIEWGTQGSGKGQFEDPWSVAVDSSMNVFVADTGNHRIQQFKLANPCPAGSTQVVPGVCFVIEWGSRGIPGGLYSPPGTPLPALSPGEFEYPGDVALGSSGKFYVADTNDHRIQLFQLANPCPIKTVQMAVKGVCYVTEWGTLGVGQGQFHFSPRVVLDSLGHIYVVDYQNHRIQKFQLADSCPSGTTPVPQDATQVNSGACFIEEWGKFGSGDGELRGPLDVAVDSSKNVFVADTYNDRIQLFKDNNPPTCLNALPSISSMWPPDHKMRNVMIQGVTDPDNDPIAIMITSIYQDEPTHGLGSGDQSPDGTGVGTDKANVRAEGTGTGDGRVYHIRFTADDGKNGMCNGEVIVSVPHDQAHTAIDSGPIYDSTIG